MPGSRERDVVIVGGGIGGLASALCLSRAGLKSIVLERRQVRSEAGAGIQIGPNGMKVLCALGLADALRPFAGVPRAIVVRGGSDDGVVGELPLGDWIADRFGNPYWVVHRVDLHRVLFEAVQDDPNISVEMNAGVSAVEQGNGDGAVVRTEAGDGYRGRVVVGADGIWSRVRAYVLGDGGAKVAPTFFCKSAARVVIPMLDVPSSIALDAVTVWMRPDGHVVCYPIRGGSALAVVAIVSDQTARERWGSPVEPGWVLSRVSGFGSAVRSLVGAGEGWCVWGLHTFPQLPTWVRGRVGLLGDAAHPILPFLAQGGVMALEDAFVLAEKLAGAPSGAGRFTDPAVSEALQAYQLERRSRVFRVQARSVRQGEIYHMSGLMAGARDVSLRMVPSKRLMAGYDWLYGWRA